MTALTNSWENILGMPNPSIELPILLLSGCFHSVLLARLAVRSEDSVYRSSSGILDQFREPGLPDHDLLRLRVGPILLVPDRRRRILLEHLADVLEEDLPIRILPVLVDLRSERATPYPEGGSPYHPIIYPYTRLTVLLLMVRVWGPRIDPNPLAQCCSGFACDLPLELLPEILGSTVGDDGHSGHARQSSRHALTPSESR